MSLKGRDSGVEVTKDVLCVTYTRVTKSFKMPLCHFRHSVNVVPCLLLGKADQRLIGAVLTSFPEHPRGTSPSPP